MNSLLTKGLLLQNLALHSIQIQSEFQETNSKDNNFLQFKFECIDFLLPYNFLKVKFVCIYLVYL